MRIYNFQKYYTSFTEKFPKVIPMQTITCNSIRILNQIIIVYIASALLPLEPTDYLLLLQIVADTSMSKIHDIDLCLQGKLCMHNFFF